jgi:hypothetical protein
MHHRLPTSAAPGTCHGVAAQGPEWGLGSTVKVHVIRGNAFRRDAENDLLICLDPETWKPAHWSLSLVQLCGSGCVAGRVVDEIQAKCG